MDRVTATHQHASNATFPPTSTSSPRLFSPARNSPPLTRSAMGQAESTPRQSELPSSGPAPQPPLSPQPTSKYRFAWPGRRKKSEDFTKLMGGPTFSPGPSLTTTAAPPPSSLNQSMSRELTRQESNLSQADSHFGLHLHELSRPPSRSSAKQLTLQFASNTLTALKGKLNASQSSIHSLRTAPTSPTTPPPPLPPKPDMSRLSSSASSNSGYSSGDWVSLERPKPLPPIADASAPVTVAETRPESVPTATGTSIEHDVNLPQRRERERREGTDAQTAKDVADDWRKSDSTLRTVRLVGSRTPRPLSLAESTNSAHTVLPSVGAGSPVGNMNMGGVKRLSALMTDVEFGLPEVDSEDDEEDDDDDESAFASAPPSAFNSMHNLQHQAPSPANSRSSSPASASGKPQPTSKRSSLSIRISRLSGSKRRTSEHGHISGSDSEALSSSVSTRGTGMGMGMCTANSSTTSVTSSPGASAKDSRPSIEIASSASIASSMSSGQRPEQYAQYKSNAKLEPWISLSSSSHPASSSQASLSTSESASTSSHTGSLNRQTDSDRSGQYPMNLSASHGPTLRPVHQRTRLQSIQARGFRQTAVSLTTGLAPAAGFARKAVDRLGRALGGSSTSLANADGDEMLAGTGNGYGHAPSASASNASLFGIAGQGQHAHPHLQQTHQRQRQHQVHGQLSTHHGPSSSKKASRRHAANPSGTWSINSNSNSNSTSLSDPDGGTAGPNLGRCMRGPLVVYNGGKGLAFGRELLLCVHDTACEVGVEGSVEGLALEGRSLPALVVRCAQHIVKWGVQEEGLFRISGRSTHVSKLRTEFDSGADYDMRECGPGEIDPHAVSSIFKAYLRELPEPLLTRHLMPYFEAALMAENNMINAADAQNTGGHNGFERMRGPGLPSGPRDSVQVRKAPSLSTFAVPTLSPRTASPTLLNALAALIARLPKENRDLLRTVTELIAATAQASRETKMPLSNLLLVFCPSLMMSPPLLRVLCEGKGIWDGPSAEVECPGVGGVPDATVKDKEKEVEKETKDGGASGNEIKEGEKEAGLQPQWAIRRSPRTSNDLAREGADTKEVATETEATTLLSTALPSNTSPMLNGKTSAASAHSKTDSSISTPLNLYSPTELTHSTNSSDSLNTPPSMSPRSVSPNVSVVLSASVKKPGLDTAGLSGKVFALRAQSDLPSPLSPSMAKIAVRKSLIGNPVPFPIGLGISRSSSGNGSPGSAPVTPIELGGSSRLSSTSSYSSSSPNLRDSASAPRLGRRKSKASLLGLASKRSLSSLFGLSQAQAQPPQMVVPDLTLEGLLTESPSPPRSSTPCPVLDLPVDTSRMQLGLDLTLTDEPEYVTDAPSTLRVPSPAPRPQGMVLNRASSDSSALTNSVFYTPPTTTRALAPAHTISAASSSSSGSYSFLDFNIDKSGEEEDWAKSVLLAAASDA